MITLLRNFHFHKKISVLPDLQSGSSFRILNAHTRRCQITNLTGRKVPQGIEYNRWGVDFGAKKSFMNRKLELNRSATDIFNNMDINQRIEKIDGSHVDYQNYYETQILTIGAKYKI